MRADHWKSKNMIANFQNNLNDEQTTLKQYYFLFIGNVLLKMLISV